MRPSAFLLAVLIGMHGLAAGALLYSDLPGTFAAGLLGALSWSLIRQLYRYGATCSPGFVVRLVPGRDGNWQLVHGNGTVRKRVLRRYYVHPWLLILQFQGPLPGLNPALAIPADAVDAESLRQLRHHLLRLDRSAGT